MYIGLSLRLTSDHLKIIRCATWNARCKWYDIGLGLGIKAAHLDAVRERNHGDPDSCFREILTNWLNRHEPVPTLSAIADALEAEAVGFGHLASEVKKLSVGKESRQQASITNSYAETCMVHKSKYHSIESGTIEFVCPCGNCSLKSYINNCCPLTTSMAFPYLNLTQLLSNQIEKENLIQGLTNAVEEINDTFDNLVDEVCDALIDNKDVNPQELARRVINTSKVHISEYHQEKLMKSVCLNESFVILKKYMSFYNFRLLEKIINWKKCPDEVQANLKGYHTKLHEFCQRKVFEVPRDAYSNMDVSTTAHKKIVFLSTKDMLETSLNDVWDVRCRLANILKLNVGNFHLHVIDQGCLLLVFSIPNSLSERLFPLDIDLVEKLKVQGFTVFAITG